MSPEFGSPNDEATVLKAGDGLEEMKAVAQRAIDEGWESDDGLLVRIPIEEDLTFLGTGIWQVIGDGEMIRASDLASRMLSDATGREIVISGSGSVKNKDSGEWESVLIGTVREE